MSGPAFEAASNPQSSAFPSTPFPLRCSSPPPHLGGSSIDVLTEARLQAALPTLTAGRSGLIVAHRLTTIRHAGLIDRLNNWTCFVYLVPLYLVTISDATDAVNN
jgi:hypothetical protein